MFSVFFTERAGPRLRRGVRARTPPRTPRSSTPCSSRGVYLPPSAYEAWFLSAAHDDRAVQTVLDALPAAARAAARADRGDRMTHETIVHLLRHGEVHNPERRALRPPARLPPLRPGRTRWPSGSPRRSGTATSPTCGSRRWSGPRRPRRRWRPSSGSTPVIDDRVIESANVFEGKRFGVGDGALRSPVGLAAPVEPVQAVVGRALQAGRRPDAGRGARRPRRRPPATRPWSSPTSCRSGSPGCPPRAGRFLHDPRKRQCTLCSLTSLHFDGRPAGPGVLLRARRRPDPGWPTRRAPFSAGDAPEEHKP